MNVSRVQYFLFLIFFFAFSKQLFSQQLNLEILNSNPSIDTKDISVILSDGVLRDIKLNNSFENNVLKISERYDAKYCRLQLTYLNPQTNQRFVESYWVQGPNARIELSIDSSSKDANPFKNLKTINVINIDEANKNLIDSILPFIQKDLDAYINSYSIKGLSVQKMIDSTKKSYISLMDKSYHYISQHKNYFYYDWFLEWFSRAALITYRYDSSFLIKTKNMMSDLKPTGENDTTSEITYFTEEINQLNNKINPLLDFYDGNFDNVSTRQQLVSSLDLTKYRGKLVLLDLWATWCVPCMAGMPHIKKLREKYKSKDLIIIGVSTDADYNKWLSTIEAKRFNWIQYLDLQSKFYHKYVQNAIPTLLLFDREGNLIFDNQDDRENAENNLDEILLSNIKD